MGLNAFVPHAGIRIGHVTHEDDRTGITAIVFEEPVLAAVEARGAAPGSRDIEMLRPGMLGRRADAIVLTGGSTFGLRTIDGVLEELVRQGRGLDFGNVQIPLVPGAVVFDLANGNPVPPSVEDGAQAVRNATPLDEVATGNVGAGTGVRWGHRAPNGPFPGGFGIGQVSVLSGMVTAVAVVNALGNVLAKSGDHRTAWLSDPEPAPEPGANTTLVAVMTDIPCDHSDLVRLCVAAHDGLARAIAPAHTMFDGDIAFATTANVGTLSPADLLKLFVATELAVESAIVNAVT